VESQAVTTVDARGLRCPLPALRLLRAAIPGATIRLVADDPAAAIDIPALAREMGWAVEATGDLSWRVTVPAPSAATARS
jgi:tRNA 2-thiouridine synthesizing protein A